MSTRCQLAFYATTDQCVNRPDAVLYRHCDGYPEGEHGVLATLVPWAVNFQQRRGLGDSEYAAARALVALVQAHVPDDVLSYGISDPTQALHGDIEFFYRIDPSGVTVWQMDYDRNRGWSSLLRRRETPYLHVPVAK